MNDDTSKANGLELIAALVAAIESGDRERTQQILQQLSGKHGIKLCLACDLKGNQNDEF